MRNFSGHMQKTFCCTRSTKSQFKYGIFRCAWAKRFQLQREIDLVEFAENFAAHGRNNLSCIVELLWSSTPKISLRMGETI